MWSPVIAAEPIAVGSRLELLLDDFLVDSMRGDVHLELHHPIRREIVFKTDRPLRT